MSQPALRVLHWYPNFREGGAVANAVLGLALGQVRLGSEVCIAAVRSPTSPLYEPMRVEDVKVVEWVAERTVLVRGIRLRQPRPCDIYPLQAIRPDLVHVHGEFNPDNLWIPRLFKCPIILSPHGAFYPEVLRRGARAARAARALYFALARLKLYRYVRAFHALCEDEREHIVGVLPQAQVYCVPEGPNVRASIPFSPPSPPRDNEPVRFVFVGRLDVLTKGLDLLLDALAAAQQRVSGRRLALMLIGPDWRNSAALLRQRADRLQIGDQVTLTGALPGGAVAFQLQQSHVYIQLSRNDAFGLSACEALLAGKPAILSRTVGLASYAEVASLPHVSVVPPRPGEAAAAIVDFVHRLDELMLLAGQHQKQIVEFFSWKRIAGQQLAMYEKFAARPPVEARASGEVGGL